MRIALRSTNTNITHRKPSVACKPVLLAILGVTLATGVPVAEAGAIHNADLFTSNTLAANDDGSTGAVDIGFAINFYGTTYDTLYVNNNGNVTFNEALSTFTPFDLLSTSTPMLAPFFGDVDTRGEGSGLVQYGQNTLNGHDVFGVNWIDVGYYGSHADKLNSFQLIIVDRSEVNTGDFDFEFNYDKIQWETGDASDGSGGLGGSSARAGWSDGVANAYEIDGSAINGALLDGGPNALVDGSLNSNVPGRYIFSVRSGQVGAWTDLDESLSSTSIGVNAGLREAELVISGAHGHPLARRAPQGQNIAWVAGDWGRDDWGAHTGSLGVAEAGLGRNLGSVQLNGAIGHTWNQQDLPLNGDFDHQGTYFLAEALIPIVVSDDSGVWVTFGGYHSWGSADITRGYVVNGGEQDYSDGSPDVRIWALRARIDWDKAWVIDDTTLSPYIEVAHSQIKMDGYSETGGSYPARFDSRSEDATDLRAGFDIVKPVTARARLLGRLELNHRVNNSPARTTGEVISVASFDYAGEDSQRDWLRVGLGVEGEVGPGVGSLMLNGTSKGEAPDLWVAANWQTLF